MSQIIFLITGLIAGAIIGYLISLVRISGKYIKREEYDRCSADAESLRLQLAHRLTPEMIAASYISRDVYTELQQRCRSLEDLNGQKEKDILTLNSEVATLRQQEKNLKDQIGLINSEIDKLHKLTQEQFANLASKLLQEKGDAFVMKNKTELTGILDPLKNDLEKFRKTIEDTRKEDIRDITQLKSTIENLGNMNQRLSEDARQLALALKGDSKIQGDWGEDRLKLIIESEGLEKYIDYESQSSLIDDDEERRRRTDIIINLPEGKHIILDSKVSLRDYVDYFNATDPEEKKKSLKKHVDCVVKHIETLSAKQYQSLTGLRSADYVFMFMPIENAYTIAMNENPRIFNIALEKKIVLITPMTLISTMKIIKLLWQSENRVKNVEKIFIECGKLYDKFVGFLDDLESVGSSLNSAQKAHYEAMNKLKDGVRKGDTIIGRFENIKSLEAKTKKQIPPKYLEDITNYGLQVESGDTGQETPDTNA